MQLSIYSWDGHLINDTTNYVAWFPRGARRMPSSFPLWATRSKTFPMLANKTIDGGILSFVIECKGTFHSQAETLKQWFAVDDFSTRRLIVKDTADSDRQWYVEGFPTEPVMAMEGGVSQFLITLALSEPLWRTVTGQSDAWAITASGQTNVLSVLGNHSARPIFTITPTSLKVGGYSYAKSLPWYNPYLSSAANNEPLEITNGGLNTSALTADSTRSCQINVGGGISAVVTTIPYDTVTGIIPSSGPAYCGTEQFSYTGKTGTTSGNLTGCTRGINGTTAAAQADNAVIYVSKIMANGNDLRAFVDGVEVDRWLSGMNTAATKIWINQKSSRAPYLLLGAAIASSGAVATVTVQNVDKSTKGYLAMLPNRFLFAIGTELFQGTSVDLNAYTLTGTARAANNTSMAAHAVGDVIRWIEHDIYLVYGNPSAAAPATDDTKKPMFNLSSSTNTSWVYEEFRSTDGLRTAAWKASYAREIYILSKTYTGSHGVMADPATEAGITLNAYQSNGVWKAGDWPGMLNWKFSHPATITVLTVTGAKYRYTSDWPTFRLISSTGIVFTEATPSVAQVWEALSSHSGVALPTSGGAYPTTLQLECLGTMSGVANNFAAIEMQAITLTLLSTKTMQFLMNIAENNSFYMDSTIANSSTGDAFSLSLPMELNKILVIDCDAETMVYDGKDIGLPLRWNTVRGPWLDFQPGSNTLTFTDTGTTPGLDIGITWEDRNTL